MTDDQLLSMLSWESVQARFWKRVDKDAPGGCWNYTSYRTFRGMVRPNEFTVHRCEMTPRRVAWALHYGELPDRDVRVACGNPLCVNHAHLVREGGSYRSKRFATPEEIRVARAVYRTEHREERNAYNRERRSRIRAERLANKPPPAPKVVQVDAVKEANTPRAKMVRIKRPAHKDGTRRSAIWRVRELARLVGFHLDPRGGGYYRVERGAAT